MYITRKLEKTVVRLSEEFPVVCVIGVRQCGKSTMLRHILPKGFREASVETLGEASLAEEDPRGYLLNHGLPLFIDEAQNAPALFKSQRRERLWFVLALGVQQNRTFGKDAGILGWKGGIFGDEHAFQRRNRGPGRRGLRSALQRRDKAEWAGVETP